MGGPHDKDYSILGSILASPSFGKLLNEPAFGVRSAFLKLVQLHFASTLPASSYVYSPPRIWV